MQIEDNFPAFSSSELIATIKYAQKFLYIYEKCDTVNRTRCGLEKNIPNKGLKNGKISLEREKRVGDCYVISILQ